MFSLLDLSSTELWPYDYSPGGNPLSKGLRILFLGMDGAMSREVFSGLLAGDHQVVAMLRPGTGPLHREDREETTAEPGEIPLLDAHLRPTAAGMARRAGIPVYATGQLRSPQVHAWLADLAVDVACVACFSRRIPQTLLDIPRFGFLNVHPSLLPAYRGPDPLFWQLRHGVDPVGVTVHWMDAGLDTGDIAAQAPLHLPEGVSGEEAEALCGRLGATLLAEVLARLAQGDVPRHPQPAGGSVYSLPGPEDFRLTPDMSARTAFNFMRGTAHRGFPYPVTVQGETWMLLQALSWEPGVRLPRPEMARGIVRIPLADGVLVATAVQHTAESVHPKR